MRPSVTSRDLFTISFQHYKKNDPNIAYDCIKKLTITIEAENVIITKCRHVMWKLRSASIISGSKYPGNILQCFLWVHNRNLYFLGIHPILRPSKAILGP